MSRLSVRVISESEFTVQGHGVHTAYLELTNAIKKHDDVSVTVNHRGQADITHIHTVGLYSLAYLIFASGKKVISAHVVPDSFVGSLVGVKYWLPLAKVYLRWFYNRADVVLAVSQETKQDLEKLGVKRPVEVFHNVIDTSRYQRHSGDKAAARKQLDLPEETTIVIGAGQVQPRKRIDTFIATAKALPDTIFIWVGGMPFGKIADDADKMDQMIKSAPGNIYFPGILPLESMKSYYHGSDIFMLPSDQETFGIVVLEAAAAGLPVVLRDIPDYDETFRADGVMVKNEEFALAIKKLSEDEVYYKTMQAASKRIADRFDSAKGADRLLSMYKRLLH